MRTALVPYLRCPQDHGQLELHADDAALASGWVEQGMLYNPRTGTSYAIRNGMAYLYVDDEQWQPLAREAAGWVQYHKDHHMYEQGTREIDFQTPYYPHDPWFTVARNFDIALEIIKPYPGMRVLDVGAGRGWASKHLALAGCVVVAVEICDDDQVGLGRAKAIMEQAGTCFDTIIADNENLPFVDSTFDLIFGSAVLHHTSNLNRLIASLQRVLRPGGRMISICEPCIPVHVDEAELRDTVLAEELAYGINESRPHLHDYQQAFLQAGFRHPYAFVWQCYDMTLAHMASWSQDLHIPPPEHFAHPNGAHEQLEMVRVSDTWRYPFRWMETLLTEHYGETILVATRPQLGETQEPDLILAPLPPTYPFTVSVVIPAHNEGHGIADVVRAVREWLPDAELLVVDDYSTDDTARQAADAGAQVIQRAANMGNGAAVKTGIRAATGDVVLLMDGDGQMDPQYIPLLLGTLAKGFDMVVGARTSGTQGDTLVRRIGNRLLDRVGSYLVETPVHDLTSGYRAVRREVISDYLHLLPNRYSYPTTSTLALLQAGYTVGFVPIESRTRQGGQSGQKVLRNGFKFLLIILRMISLFAPLRVYLPVAAAMLLLALLSFLISFFITDPYRFRLPNSVVALSVGAIVVFMFGLLAEQIAALRRRPE